MKIRTFTLLGYTIELWDFKYRQYLYPSFNGDAEFPNTKEGYKKLYHYLRLIKSINIC